MRTSVESAARLSAAMRMNAELMVLGGLAMNAGSMVLVAMPMLAPPPTARLMPR